MVDKWICQYNPHKYILIQAAQNPELGYLDLWPTHGKEGRRKPNAGLLKKGDLCLFWESGDNAGFVGYGIVKEGAHTRDIPKIYTKYERVKTLKPIDEVIEITYEKLFTPRILLSTLEMDSSFNKNLFQKFLKRRQGTFYEIAGADWHFLEKYLLPELEISAEASISEFTEALVDLEESSDLPEPVLTDPLARKRTTTQRTIRDKKFSDTCKKLYNYQCAICRKRRYSLKETPEVDAAHINPKEREGPDDFRNGLALCKLHHWAFDEGLFSLSDDHKIIVHESIKGKPDYEEIYTYEGKMILIPNPKKYAPDPLYLKEHRSIHHFEN